MKINDTQALMQRVRQSIDLEILALQELIQNIDYQSISYTLSLIIGCKGRVVFCGLGKSGHIAKKIAATWTSTGTASIFLHASEALHGDLGVLQSGDVLITVSNSGETDELLRLVPFARKLKLPHIAFVGNPKSTLARYADVFLQVGVSRELLTHADLSAVPLASCLSTLALGDVLTVLLVEQKGFAQADFRDFHPAGNIGQKLLLPISERMQRDNLPQARADTPMRDLLLAMTRGAFGMVVICDELAKIQAVITDGDIRRALQRHDDALFFGLRAADIATFAPKCLSQTATLWEAETLMSEYKINVIPIFDEAERFCGILSKHQL
jgi:arabinose-5-phosphate isomerase